MKKYYLQTCLALLGLLLAHHVMRLKTTTIQQGSPFAVSQRVNNETQKFLEAWKTKVRDSLQKILHLPTSIYHEELINYLTGLLNLGWFNDQNLVLFVTELLEAETQILMSRKDPCKLYSDKFKEKVYIWVRFSKIGGTTFHQYLMRFAREFGLVSKGCDYYSNNNHKFNLSWYDTLLDYEKCGPLERDNELNQTIIFGHQAFGNHRLFPNKQPVYLMITRNEVDVAYSHYNYDSAMKRVPEESLQEYMVGSFALNPATRYTCGPSFKRHHTICSMGNNISLAVAKYNLARVDFIPGWFVDSFNLTREVLTHFLWEGFSEMNTEKKVMPLNLTYKKQSISYQTRTYLQNLNAFDHELNIYLWDYIEKMLDCL